MIIQSITQIPMQSSNYTGVFNAPRYSVFDRSLSATGYAYLKSESGDGADTNYTANDAVFFE